MTGWQHGNWGETMLSLFGKKSDHPLADMKSAQQVVNDIPKQDALGALQEITGWIESLQDGADEFKLDHYFSVLRLLDEAAQPHVRKLLRDYFVVQPLHTFQENRLWGALTAYYSQAESVHYDVFGRYRKNGRGAAAIKPLLPLLSVRAIAALSGRLKMAAARYALVEPYLWQHLAELYLHAESNGYQTEAALPHAAVNTSINRELTTLLLWYGASVGTLSPLHTHLAERLVAHCGRSYLVSKNYADGGAFVFDTAQPTPPLRMSPEATVHPGLRYLGLGDALAQLEGLLKAFDKGVVPEELNLGGASYDAEMLGDVARRLISFFALPPQARRSPRRRIKVNLQVTNGFFKVLEQTDVGLNFSQENGESWDVEDISATGFRSVIANGKVVGLKIGSLVGSKPENVPNWGVGIVRRLSRDEQNRLHIGVEVLSNQIVGVTLNDASGLSMEGEQVALYLNRPNDSSGDAWLLQKPDTFSAGRSLSMRAGDKSFLLLPLGLVEKGEDFDFARYRKMEQDSGSDEPEAY